jgi:(1->4)-alpha-D-glucan 1-alpha-D-glucosylmutase
MNLSISIPTATYRLQFHKGFTFRDARDLAPYLHELGISHVYASPFFRAAPGSTHGYDVSDHNALNPELGSRDDFESFANALKESGMGLIADFVPNHMGIAESQNAWWQDVLENGPASPYARFFDVDWRPRKTELTNKVLLPILGDQYGRVLEAGEFRLHFEEGAFFLDYYANRLPLAPRTIGPVLERAGKRMAEPSDELQSIVTAISHLPERTDLRAESLSERQRETRIIRERLARLCQERPEVCAAIGAELESLHSPSTPEGFDGLDALINEQSYRLSYWRVASEEINYRRFFDVNTLAAIRMELPEVFDATHRLLLELIAAGFVTGVRIDHIDGLANPAEYLASLQAHAAAALGKDAGTEGIYLLVEKILGAGEKLRDGWPIHGTTGYEFANDAVELLLDALAQKPITESYAKFVGGQTDYREIVYISKRLVMQVSMASEVNSLGQLLNRLSESNRWYRDFTVNALTTAVREVIACFPIYRSYLVPGQPADEADTRIILRAIAGARRRNPALERTVFEFLRSVLLPPEENPHPVDEHLRRTFVLKFQQCTGPIAAKGVEDTAFYIYNRFVALNEVGGEPGNFGTTIEAFHRKSTQRLAAYPHSLLATSTHDTKRSEDVRARLAALSELPKEWAHAVRRWQTANRGHKGKIEGEEAPDANEEYLIYQTLLGSWPFAALDDASRPAYVSRIQEYMMKALKEAKVNSSWIETNEAWESAARDFIAKILDPARSSRFLQSFEGFVEKIAQCGAINSLSQTVLKLTLPGVPDFYQGSELWDLSLVDPDNRRPVDFESRRAELSKLSQSAAPAELLGGWRDGRIKLFAIRTLLRFRRDNPALFAAGDYVPVSGSGSFAECCVAFERRGGDQTLLVLAPRLTSRVGFPAIGDLWRETKLAPRTTAGLWRDLLTGKRHTASPALSVADLLRDLPIAALLLEP